MDRAFLRCSMTQATTRGGAGASTSGRVAPTISSSLRQQATPKIAASLSLGRLRGAVSAAAAASDSPGAKTGDPAVPPAAKKPAVASSSPQRKAPTTKSNQPKPQAAATAASSAEVAPTTSNASAPAPPSKPAAAPAAVSLAKASPVAAAKAAGAPTAAAPAAPAAGTSNQNAKPPALSARYAPVAPQNVRNFSIIAHIDHGCVSIDREREIERERGGDGRKRRRNKLIFFPPRPPTTSFPKNNSKTV